MSDHALRQANQETQDIVETTQHRVACEGSGGALGHPRVFLDMGKGDRVTCPYCDRVFILKPAHPH